jgi:isoamylase
LPIFQKRDGDRSTPLQAGQIYAYRAAGPYLPSKGLRFDPTKVLIDPYTCAVVGQAHYDRQAACEPGENCPHALRGVVNDRRAYDWEGDIPLEIPYATSVIYEMHVGGFTRHPLIGAARRAAGHLCRGDRKNSLSQALGITAVELLPIHQFDTSKMRRLG